MGCAAAAADPMSATAAVPTLMQQTADARFPWCADVPEELLRSTVLPEQVIHEKPCDWRPVLTPIAQNLVRGCATAREAVLALATGLPQATGVHYSIERRAACMNALEALNEKKVSCTGQSIFLVCALRSVGIPARVVGITTWNHILGNHTWAEAWFEGDWHMIEYNEKDFNTPWVMENIGMTDPQQPVQRIYAATPNGKAPYLPAYVLDKRILPAEDVSGRYAALARNWYEKNGLSPQEQRLMVEILPRPAERIPVSIISENGETVSSAELPSEQDDVRELARLVLPREGVFYLNTEGVKKQLTATDAPVQILRLQMGK